MCLAVPGKIIEIKTDDSSNQLAMVDFQGNIVEASIAMTPEAVVGDWVLVHAGFSISIVDEQDAQETFELLNDIIEAGRDEVANE